MKRWWVFTVNVPQEAEVREVGQGRKKQDGLWGTTLKMARDWRHKLLQKNVVRGVANNSFKSEVNPQNLCSSQETYSQSNGHVGKKVGFINLTKHLRTFNCGHVILTLSLRALNETSFLLNLCLFDLNPRPPGF